jgi:hypothetical protein
MNLMIDHKQRKHALLSASGAKRWINCPPSARLEEKHDKGHESSIFAEEGTLAHEIADNKLRIATNRGRIKYFNALKKEAKNLQKHKLYKSEMQGFTDQYCDYVLEALAKAKKQTPDAVLKIEEKTDFSHIVPEGFGTSDANIIADDLLEIVDLKYGTGIKVDAVDNPQLRLYALGLLHQYTMLYNIKRVKMTIVQPRLDHIDSETMTVEQLNEWATDTAKPAAEKAFKGKGDCNPGDWCKWCKASHVCRSLHDYNMQLANNDFAEPKELSKEEILQAYNKSNLLTDWVKAISKHILETALNGEQWDGLKVVEGRSVRKWSDEERVIQILQKAHNYDIKEITNTKIAGIGQIEKLLGRGNFNALDAQENLTVKPEGKPTLAPMDDKRPALKIGAEEDFKQ